MSAGGSEIIHNMTLMEDDPGTPLSPQECDEVEEDAEVL